MTSHDLINQSKEEENIYQINDSSTNLNHQVKPFDTKTTVFHKKDYSLHIREDEKSKSLITFAKSNSVSSKDSKKSSSKGFTQKLSQFKERSDQSYGSSSKSKTNSGATLQNQSITSSSAGDLMNSEEEQRFNQKLLALDRHRTAHKSQVVSFDHLMQKKQKKYTVSYIKENFTQLTKAVKQMQKAEFIEKLTQTNENHFRGRQLRFSTGGNYYQCLANPQKENTFFTV